MISTYNRSVSHLVLCRNAMDLMVIISAFLLFTFFWKFLLKNFLRLSVRYSYILLISFFLHFQGNYRVLKKIDDAVLLVVVSVMHRGYIRL